MEKPKTLEQLRAERERAETQLLQEQHKLERLENRKKTSGTVCTSRNFDRSEKDHAVKRGRDASEQRRT